MDKPTIIAIDGDPKNLQILRESLEAAKFYVITSDNGNDAFTKIKNRRPDIIVSEVDIPGIDGFQLLERLQNDPVGASIPIVFLTNRRNLEDRLKSLRSGVKDYMIKPLHVKEVIARLQMILRRIERIKNVDEETSRKEVGRLEENSVEELLENYGAGRKTGVLSLYDPHNRNGEIFFRDGTVVNARIGNFRAEKAVYQMLPWREGHYIMTFKEVSVKDEITVSNLGLLLQGFKRLQQRQKFMQALPPLDTVLRRTSMFDQILRRKAVNTDAAKFISLFDGQRSLNQILTESTYDDLTTLERVHKLFQQGFIEPLGGTPNVGVEISSRFEHALKPEKTESFSTGTMRAKTPTSKPQEAGSESIPPKKPVPLEELSRSEPAEQDPLEEPELESEPDQISSYDLEAEIAKALREDMGPESKAEPQVSETQFEDAEEEAPFTEPELEETLEDASEDTDGTSENTRESFHSESIPNGHKSVSLGKSLDLESDLKHPFPDSIAYGGQKGATEPDSVSINGKANGSPATRRSASLFGVDFDKLLDAQTLNKGHIVVIGAHEKSRRHLIESLASGKIENKSVARRSIEIGRVVTPSQKRLDIIGISPEGSFLRTLEEVKPSLLGYVILISAENSSRFGYLGYLLNFLKGKYSGPHVLAVQNEKGSRLVPLDFIRYSLHLDDDEQIVDVDVCDMESVHYLLKQLVVPAYKPGKESHP